MLLIYKSSAGSGKTYTLVKEFIRLALGPGKADAKSGSGSRFRHILAITFTNKAANEMKERIFQTLQQLSRGDEKVNDLMQELAAETNLPPQELTFKAGRVLRKMLHDYSDVSVSTIDSFVHRVIRAFTYDLHLPMNFEIELEREKLLTETIELLMDRLSDEDNSVTNAVVEFAESNIEEGKSWNLEHSLIKLAEELFNEDAYKYLDKLQEFELKDARKIKGALYQFSALFEQKVFNEGKQAIRLINDNNLEAKSFFQSNKGIYGYFLKYAEGEIPNDPLGNSFVQKTISENKWPGGKAGESEISAIEGIKGQLENHYRNIAQQFNNHGQDYALAGLLQRNFYSFILLADIQKLMAEYKKANNILHISEFQEKVNAVVREQEAPVIYERIGDWYNNILIDEHQDTSVLQWQNLLPLIENSQVKTEDSLVVGDGKQAIYRFRNGKVEQFAMLPEIFGSKYDMRLKEREIVINNYGTETRHLSYNYRSRREIVEFNNLFYDILSGFTELKNKTIYENQIQKQGRDAAGGFVSVEFLADDDESELDINRCNRVREIVQDSVERGYSLRDIAVLTRSNLNAAEIASFLISSGIGVVSSESLLVNNSANVKLILATLYYFERRDNHIARAEILYYIHRLLLKQDLRFDLFDFKSEETVFEEYVSRLLEREFRSYNFLNYRFVELVRELTVFYGMSDMDPFVQFFLEEALTFSSRHRGNIREFLEWWDEVKYKKSIIYPETLDAVKVMTIHKSKGLQFPIVVVADADWPQRNTKKHFWVQIDKSWLKGLNTAVLPVVKEVMDTEFVSLYEEEEASSFLDMLNTVYVATTRAEDILYVLSKVVAKEPANNNSVTALFINFLKQQGIWDGFKPYRFGDSETKKLPKEGRREDEKKVYNKQQTGVKPNGTRQPVIKKDSKLLWNETTVAKIEKGNLMHEIMKQVSYAPELNKILNKLVAQGLISGTELPVLHKKLSAVMNNPLIRPCFHSPYKVMNERALMNQEQIKVPDRVVSHNNNAVVIDYKTGERKREDIKQIDDYAALLKQFGFAEVRKFLVYIEDEVVEEV